MDRRNIKVGIPKGYKFQKRKSPKPFTKEHIEKIRQTSLGRKMPPRTAQWVTRHSESMRGKKQSAETIEKRVSKFRGSKHHNWKGGLPRCIDCGETKSRVGKRCRSCLDLINKGENHPNWKGGIELKLVSNRNYRALKKNAVGTFSLEEWVLLKVQYGNKCPRCNKNEPDIKLTVDHIIPLSKGGSNLIENIQPLCVSCNSYKSNRYIVKYNNNPI
jgi:5-methylcytosine-specific restriction endonuclease McrA